jgi:hypothetical protein
MSRIDSLLASTLFQNVHMRVALKRLIENRMDVNLAITEFPIDLVLPDGQFNDEICCCIRDAKWYINYEHEAKDKKFQQLVFLSLVYSFNEFNEDSVWDEFLKKDYAHKKEKVTTGIKLIWTSFQNQLILRYLGEDFDPFPF